MGYPADNVEVSAYFGRLTRVTVLLCKLKIKSILPLPEENTPGMFTALLETWNVEGSGMTKEERERRQSN